jgi:hypothetical protein
MPICANLRKSAVKFFAPSRELSLLPFDEGDKVTDKARDKVGASRYGTQHSPRVLTAISDLRGRMVRFWISSAPGAMGA